MSQNNNFANHVQERKMPTGLTGVIQQPVNTGSRKQGVKTAGPSLV